MTQRNQNGVIMTLPAGFVSPLVEPIARGYRDAMAGAPMTGLEYREGSDQRSYESARINYFAIKSAGLPTPDWSTTSDTLCPEYAENRDAAKHIVGECIPARFYR
jgi:hypothetical protein